MYYIIGRDIYGTPEIIGWADDPDTVAEGARIWQKLNLADHRQWERIVVASDD